MNESVIALRPVPDRKELLGRLADDLDRFYGELRERLRSDEFLIDQGVRYLVKVRGKALRPFVVLACARLFGQPNDLTYRAAMIVELLHTATLIHDDVVDKAETRRRWPTFNRLWGNKFSVLFGDYLLAHSLIATLEKGNLEVVQLLADTARQMSQGQLKELARSRKKDLSRERYLAMITDKTASLFRACALLGAMTLERSPEEQQALADFGLHLGVAFQIRDDCLDFTGSGTLLGKAAHADVKQKKFTLPLLCALERCGSDERKQLLKRLDGLDRHPAEAQSVYAFVDEHCGTELAGSIAVENAERAVAQLRGLPDSDSKSLLIDLAVFAARRNA